MSDPELHPYVWGPALWNVLFTIAFHADPTVSDDVAALFSELRFTLPQSRVPQLLHAPLCPRRPPQRTRAAPSGSGK